MLLNTDDFGNDHLIERRSRRLHRLDFDAAHRQCIREFAARERRANKSAQPVFGELHAMWARLIELLQEPQIVLEEQAQIVDAITQHGQSIGAEAEREALVFLAVDVYV